MFIQRPNILLSEQRNSVKEAELPLPLYAALNVKPKVSETIYHGMYSVFFTAFKLAQNAYGLLDSQTIREINWSFI